MNWSHNENLALKGRFISDSIKKFILKNTIDKKTFEVSPILTFTIYYFNTLDNRVIENRAKDMVHLVREFQEQYKTTNEMLHVFWFPTPILKEIPNSNQSSLNVSEINSACTFHYPNNRFIAIYRFEEAPKVLYHELVHFYHLDMTFNDSLDKYFIQKYSLKVPCSLKETYSEFVGCFLNIDRVSKKSGLPFELLYNIELAFMIYQAQKILKYFNIENLEQLTKMKSDTNLITYYLFKSALFITISNPKKYLEKMKRSKLVMNSPNKFVENIELGLVQLFKMTNIENIEGLENTMRMTIIEE